MNASNRIGAALIGALLFTAGLATLWFAWFAPLPLIWNGATVIGGIWGAVTGARLACLSVQLDGEIQPIEESK